MNNTENQKSLWNEAFDIYRYHFEKESSIDDVLMKEFTITRNTKNEDIKPINSFPTSRNLKFYKEADERWYVELPEWEGSKADLEMVAGADTMLNYMAEGEDKVYLYLSVNYFNGCDTLEFVRFATEIDNGAHYVMKRYAGIEFNLDVWICDVCRFVFGRMPMEIYLSKYNKD